MFIVYFKANEHMFPRILFSFFLSLCLVSCNGQNNSPLADIQGQPIRIHRFDRDLFKLIETKDTVLQTRLTEKYPRMLEIAGKGILNMQSPTMPGFFDKLIKFYSEPTLISLYRDAIGLYDSIAPIEGELGNGFARLQVCFPTMQVPAVYMHVSGLNQNVLAGDSVLSLSIDKYMGKDYPLYQTFFYDYQRQKMTAGQMVPDYIAGWLMSEYPFAGKENVLLDRMIYEGKIKYLLHLVLPEKTQAELMGYTDTSLKWCKENEANLWKAIVERKHLYTPDLVTTAKYFEDMPSSFLSSDAPGNIGVWVGWQIVNRYMTETKATPSSLMENTDSQGILTASKYKP